MKKLLFSAAIFSAALAIFLSPGPSKAANCNMYAGELLSPFGNTAVYILSPENKMYFFPTQDVYRSWYGDDFSGVREIDPSCLIFRAVAGPMHYRPGARLVKRVVSNDVFAVLDNGELRKIEDEATATKYYGANWNSMVRDVHDSFFTAYQESNIKLSALHNGQLIRRGSQIFRLRNGKLYAFQSELPRHVADFAIPEDSSLTKAYPIASGSIELGGPFDLSLPEVNKPVATPVPPVPGNLTCTDSDEDGYHPEGGQCGPVDCDDSHAMSNPGGFEICLDGGDNDCDGEIDEDDCRYRRICLGEGCPSAIIYE